MGLTDEIAQFTRGKIAGIALARELAAVRLSCGIDLPDPRSCDGLVLQQAVGRIARALKRERLKGLNRHWSYDLNRHIALKQALDRLRGGPTANPAGRRVEKETAPEAPQLPV